MAPAIRDYPLFITVPASHNMFKTYRSTTKVHKVNRPVSRIPICSRPTDQLQRYTRVNLTVLKPAKPRRPNPTTVWLVQLQVRETSPDGSMDLNTGDTAQPRYTHREELDCLASTSGAALYSAEASIQELNLA